MDVAAIREEIPALARTVYLNTGGTGPSPRRVTDAGARPRRPDCPLWCPRPSAPRAHGAAATSRCTAPRNWLSVIIPSARATTRPRAVRNTVVGMLRTL